MYSVKSPYACMCRYYDLEQACCPAWSLSPPEISVEGDAAVSDVPQIQIGRRDGQTFEEAECEAAQRVRLGCGTDFFFSSRRRHTRCSRDWSSDVCSSD